MIGETAHAFVRGRFHVIDKHHIPTIALLSQQCIKHTATVRVGDDGAVVRLPPPLHNRGDHPIRLRV